MIDNGCQYFINANVAKPSLLLDADWLRRTFAAAPEGFGVLDFVSHKFDGGGNITRIGRRNHWSLADTYLPRTLTIHRDH